MTTVFWFISKKVIKQQVCGTANGDFSQSLVAVSKMVSTSQCQDKVFGAVAGYSKKNINVNIPTKERISNLYLFLRFIKNFRKFTKIVLTTVAE